MAVMPSAGGRPAKRGSDMLQAPPQDHMPDIALSCRRDGCGTPVEISDAGAISHLMHKLRELYHRSTLAADDAAQYWADTAVTSQNPLAPLAHVPGAMAALWTPDFAPTTATVLGAEGYGFTALRKQLIHFTTKACGGYCAFRRYQFQQVRDSRNLWSGRVHGTNWVSDQRVHRQGIAIPDLSPHACRYGTHRPYLVYVRWGFKGVKIP